MKKRFQYTPVDIYQHYIDSLNQYIFMNLSESAVLLVVFCVVNFLGDFLTNGFKIYMIYNILPILFMYLLKGRIKQQSGKIYLSSEVFQNNVFFQFSDTGITVKNQLGEMKKSWNELKEYRNLKREICLYLGSNELLIFPKRILNDQEELNFLKLVQSKLPQRNVIFSKLITGILLVGIFLILVFRIYQIINIF